MNVLLISLQIGLISFFAKIGLDLKQKVNPLDDVEEYSLKGDGRIDNDPRDTRKAFKFTNTNSLEMMEIIKKHKDKKSLWCALSINLLTQSLF